MAIKYSSSDQARILFVSRIIAFAIRFLTPVFLARLLSQTDYGLYRQFLLIATTIISFLLLGIPKSTYYFYPKKENKNEVISITYLLLISVCVLLIVIFFPFRNVILLFWKNSGFNPQSINLLFIYIVFAFLSIFIEDIFVLEKKSNIVFFYNIFNAILRFSLIVLSVLFFRALYKLLMALVIFQLLRSLVLFIYLKKQYSISSRYIKFSSVSEILRYSLPLGMGNAIGNMGRNIENYVITYLLSPEKFAIYAIANFRIPYLHMVYDSMSSVAILKISELQRNNDLNNIILNCWTFF